MRKLLYFNFILQVLFIRVYVEIQGGAFYDEAQIIGGGVVFWVVPFTGWRTPFKYIGEPKYLHFKRGKPNDETNI